MSKIKIFSLLSMATLGAHMTTTPAHGQALRPQKKQNTVEAMFSSRKSVERRQARGGTRFVAEIAGFFLSTIVVGSLLGVLGINLDISSGAGGLLFLTIVDSTGITKNLFGLEVVDAEGEPLAIGKLFIRAALKYWLNIVNLLGLFIDDKRLLHNKFLDCYVVYKEKRL